MTSREEVMALVDKLNEMSSVKYIMADKRISDALKIIAGSEILFQLFEHCTQNFDFYRAKRECFIPGDIGEGGKFVRPRQDSEFLALVFLVFYEFDVGKMDLIKVVNTYFAVGRGADVSANYDSFIEKFVRPFTAVLISVTDQILGASQKKEVVEEPQPQKEEPTRIPRAVLPYQDELDDAKKLLSLDKVSLFNYKLKDDLKVDLMLMIDGLDNALYEGNKEYIRYAFTAYKYAVAHYKKLPNNVEDIEKVLIKGGIL